MVVLEKAVEIDVAAAAASTPEPEGPVCEACAFAGDEHAAGCPNDLPF